MGDDYHALEQHMLDGVEAARSDYEAGFREGEASALAAFLDTLEQEHRERLARKLAFKYAEEAQRELQAQGFLVQAKPLYDMDPEDRAAWIRIVAAILTELRAIAGDRKEGT